MRINLTPQRQQLGPLSLDYDFLFLYLIPIHDDGQDCIHDEKKQDDGQLSFDFLCNHIFCIHDIYIKIRSINPQA